jgi:hypothetical protein
MIARIMTLAVCLAVLTGCLVITETSEGTGIMSTPLPVVNQGGAAPSQSTPGTEYWWIWYNVQSGQPAQFIEEPTAAAVENATGFPPLAGPFPTKAAAQAYATSSGITQKTTPTTPSISNPLDALTEIGDFFHRLTEAETWERLGEVLLGGIIIWAGIKALTTGQSPVRTAARTASAPARAAGRTTKRAAGAAVTYAAPEVRLAGRVAAKKVAPKTTARYSRARTRVTQHHTYAKQYGSKKPYNPSSNVRPLRRTS